MIIDFAKRSIEYRRKILKYIHEAGAGHTGGSLSCVDILNVLYNHVMSVGPHNFSSPDRDRYIQSKGHSVEALYVASAVAPVICNVFLSTIAHRLSSL